jgi:acetolactate synthase-1/2/3 large subunit
METEGTMPSAWDQHLSSEFAAKSADQALATMKEDVVSHTPNGAEVILDLLRTNGTDCIFASPIATMAPLWEALAARRERGEPEAPRYFHCRHEMLAVSAASGYYKATGRAQAVFLPTGFGVLHGAMALRTALQERTPMTVLSPDTLTYGEIPSLDPGPEWPSLLVDFAGPARQGELCVKWAKEARTPGDLIHELRRALYFAEAIPRGPTLLSVPFDLLMSATPFEARPRIEPRPVLAPPAQLDEVAALLARSAEPIIITEHGGRTEDEVAALIGLAEALAAPIFEFIMPAYHNAPRGHPLVMPGTVEPVLSRADAIVVAGSNAPWHPPNAPLRPGCAVIHLEEDPLRPRVPYWGYRTTEAVAGDRAANLRGLVERVRRRLPSPPQDRGARWTAYKRQGLAQARKDADAAQAQVEAAVPPADLFRALHRALPASTSIVDEIVSEITQMKQFLFESKPFRQYRGWTGALGTGLGTALGVKLARPGDTVVCVIGDGAFHYNPVPAALGFAQQYGTPILIVVCDNRGYASQTWNVHRYFADGAAARSGQFFGDVLSPTPDYVRLAEAYGGTGERVESTAVLESAIDRALAALAAGRSALLDVFLAGGKWQG